MQTETQRGTSSGAAPHIWQRDKYANGPRRATVTHTLNIGSMGGGAGAGGGECRFCFLFCFLKKYSLSVSQNVLSVNLCASPSLLLPPPPSEKRRNVQRERERPFLEPVNVVGGKIKGSRERSAHTHAHFPSPSGGVRTARQRGVQREGR